jgi:hypothetical protein
MAKPADADDPEAYNAAWAALEYEKIGLLDSAEAQWARVKGRFPEEAKLAYALKDDVLAKARWGWLADKRIADVAAVKTETDRLKKKIADSRPVEQPLRTNSSSPEALAIKALRLRTFGDHDRAARVCDTLISLTEKDPDKRTWVLLGNQIKSSLTRSGVDPVTARLQRLGKWLDETEKQASAVKNDPDRAADQREVRNRCRDVVELYEDDTEEGVKAGVERANKIAATVPKG